MLLPSRFVCCTFYLKIILYEIQDQSTRIECQVSKVGTNFEHVNILGIDSLRILNVSLTMNWRANSFSLINKTI